MTRPLIAGIVFAGLYYERNPAESVLMPGVHPAHESVHGWRGSC